MKELLEKIDNIASIPERHTFFQLKNFILGKEATIQGQLWQTVRELKSRKETIDSLEFQIAETEDNVSLIDIKIESVTTKERENIIKKRKLEREKKVLQKTIESLKQKLKYLLEEVTFLLGAFEALNDIEPMKPIDDIQAQKNYWNEKLTHHLNLKLLLRSPLDVDFVSTILALPDDTDIKVHMLGILDKVQKALEHK